MNRLEYFDIHGRALSIRMVFWHTNTQFDDHRFGLDFQEFGALKGSGALKFGQVPRLVLADKKELYQTNAILRYVGKTLGNKDMYPGNSNAELSY